MKPLNIPVRRWEFAALVGILVIAAALRMGAPGITEFKRDEANLSQKALDLVHGRDLPLLGIQSSVDIPNPPISVYLLALPFALDNNPRTATVFVGLLNVIAVGLAWWLARRYYGPWAAVIAGLLYAANPWAVIYSRKIWAQDLLPPFILAVVITGLLGFGEGKRWARWAHWPLLALALQIHYAAFVLVLLSLLMLILWHRQIERRSMIGGLILAALTVIPVLIGAYRADLLSLDTLRGGMDSGTDHTISSRALDYAWLTVAGTDIHSLAGPEQFRAYLASVPDVYPLFRLVPWGAVLGAVGLLWLAFRRRTVRSSPDLILVVWLVLPVLAFTWQWTEVFPHYMIPLLPPAYIVCGAGTAALIQTIRGLRARQILRAGMIALVLVIAGLQVFLFVKLLRFLDTHTTPGGFGTPLHTLLDVRDTVRDQNPVSVIVISEGERAPYDQEPAVWSVLLDGVPDVRFVNGTRTAVLPAETSIELIAWMPGLKTCPSPDCGGEIIPQRPGSSPYIVRQTAAELAGPFTKIDPVFFANGATLTGYSLSSDSVRLLLELNGPARADVQAFVHALDASEQKIAQADRFSWPGESWRSGDRLILWFDLALPAGTASLRVGMYTLVDGGFDNVDVLDEQGAYLAQEAAISLNP